MKLKLIITLLIFCAALAWWQLASSGDGKSNANRNTSGTSLLDESVQASEFSNQKRTQTKMRPVAKNLRDTLARLDYSVTAERISATSAVGTVLLRGPNGLEISTEELQISQSSGDLVFLGPTVVRYPDHIMSSDGEDAILRMNSDGQLSSTGKWSFSGRQKTVDTKPQE